jgi:alcohol oxidase
MPTILTSCRLPDATVAPPGQYFSISAFIVYPESRGHIHIAGTSTSDQPDFNPGFFTDEGQVDIKKHVWVYKTQREIARRMSIYRGEVVRMHPPFPASSKAACVELTEPLVDVEDIVYTAEDDAVIEQWLRDHVGTTWHSLGTCKMAPLADGGVVDAKLGVHKVQNLKIVDLSIVPVNVAGNTNSLAFAVGEKAVDLFTEELSLKCRDLPV